MEEKNQPRHGRQRWPWLAWSKEIAESASEELKKAVGVETEVAE